MTTSYTSSTWHVGKQTTRRLNTFMLLAIEALERWGSLAQSSSTPTIHSPSASILTFQHHLNGRLWGVVRMVVPRVSDSHVLLLLSPRDFMCVLDTQSLSSRYRCLNQTQHWLSVRKKQPFRDSNQKLKLTSKVAVVKGMIPPPGLDSPALAIRDDYSYPCGVWARLASCCDTSLVLY